MPRNNSWFDDDNTTTRDRSERFEGRPNRSRDNDRNERGMFGSDRNDRSFSNDRNDRNFSGSDREDRGYRSNDDKYAIGGWGERDRDRDRDRDRSDRDRDFGGRSTSRDEDRRYGSDDYNRGVPMDETKKLIASNKVEGTPVYDRHGDKLGSIHNFMVDKRKGHVVYAVLKHGGGFLGLNERYYPIEWDQLTYDTRLDGYHVQITEEDLKNFGSFDSEGRWQRQRPQGERTGRDQNRSRDYDRQGW